MGENTMAKPMKICFCIGRLSFSGAENVIRYLAEELIARGHEVSVLLLERMPEEKDLIKGLAVEAALVDGGGFVNALRRAWEERKVLKKLKPDVFIIFNFAMAYTAVPAALGLKNIKTVVCERNDPTCVPKSKKRRMIRDVLFGLADACVSQTEAISLYFEKIAKKRYVIPNPIREKGQMCEPLSQRRNVFVTVARLDDYQKNQSMMIRGFAEAAKQHPEYELHFLGDGADLEKYQNLAAELGVADKVKFLGKHPRPLEYVRTCRAFVLTSHYEGMPNALIEAMSSGMPCISTDCLGGGAAALISNEENGILIPRDDEKAFTEQVIRLMEDDSLCVRLGEKAFGINDTLAGENIVSVWEALCRELTEN